MFFCVALLTLFACDTKPEYYKLTGLTMGTSYQVTLAARQSDLSEIKNQIDQRLATINQLMSTYIEDSELSRFNRAETTNCYPLSEETLQVIRGAQEVSTLSKGKFDITLAPLIEIWGFDKKDTHDRMPDETTIGRLLDEIGYQKLTLDSDCVAKAQPDLSINLSAIAKGYGVDEIARLLQSKKIEHYLVEIGGEVANKGRNARSDDWRIAIETATSERGIQRVIRPQGMGIATSGDYRNYFEKDGKRFSHTIDPTNGFPITHALASITVLHPQTMMADAFATAMMVMGPEQSLEFAQKNQLAILMLVKDSSGFKEVYSDAFEPYLD